MSFVLCLELNTPINNKLNHLHRVFKVKLKFKRVSLVHKLGKFDCEPIEALKVN